MGSGVSTIDDVSKWNLDSKFLKSAEQVMAFRNFETFYRSNLGNLYPQMLLKSLAENPSNAVELNYLLGLVYYHLGEWTKATSFLQEVVATNETAFAKNASELIKKANINHLTGIDLPFGATEPLNAENLLKPPSAFLQEPVDIKPLGPISLIESAKAAIEVDFNDNSVLILLSLYLSSNIVWSRLYPWSCCICCRKNCLRNAPERRSVVLSILVINIFFSQFGAC